EGNDVLFEVSDNGAGINNARLKSIQNVLNKHTLIDLDSANGFGLFNVNQRIWMHFGDDYGITILSSPQTGTTVRLKIRITEQDSSAVLTD
ncbi:MAG TPA: ATP-binding protein, partial [Clostridia bacterium]|nr:ATP-binding protein [Clostridia bacterium]